MGIPVMILGGSGSGKSASMRNLNPNTYGLINVVGKPLPFKSDKRPINSDDYATITAALKRASSDIIVIDDAQYLMANEFMRRAKETGYQKFTDIGLSFWNLIRDVSVLPPQKVVYFLGHTEVDQNGFTKFKTIGKMLDEKITVEGLFTIVLRTFVQDEKFYFSTINDGTDTVKSPIGMFTDHYIDNDLALVDAAIRNYYSFPAPSNTSQAPATQAATRREHANSLV
ncbi:MAG: AAA family ATPase [Rectinema sp.]